MIVKRLRNIRDTVKHDNFITIEDKKYVESLISMHLRNQPLDESEPQLTRKLAPKRSVSADSSTSNFSNNKKLGITAGVVAAIALIVVAGFSMQTNGSDRHINKFRNNNHIKTYHWR